MQCKRYSTNIESAKSEAFHEPLAYGPHTSSLAVHVHRNRHQHEEKLYTTDR